jgi:UDP-N-acetylmuramyl pentapeptide phosphotransferase/UDP-N-acetylglucosamine-1-phosphate transferase
VPIIGASPLGPCTPTFNILAILAVTNAFNVIAGVEGLLAVTKRANAQSA